MNYDRLKEEVLPRWEEILRQITSPARKKGYVCPFCDNGNGETGDGIELKNPKSFDYRLKCYKCGFYGDILDIIGEAEGLDSFTDQIKRACFYLGINPEEQNSTVKRNKSNDFLNWDSVIGSDKPTKKLAQNKPKNERSTNKGMDIHTDTYTQTDTQPPKDYSSYYRECNNRLDKLDYLSSRGISTETANRLGLGYDLVCNPLRETHPESTLRWRALIIPVSKSNYVVRNTDLQATGKDRYKNVGKSTPYRARKALTEAQLPIYVVEGELDSISILEVGGEALGLGSTSNYTQLVKIIEGGLRPTQPLVLALDNDEAGRTASEKLAKELDRLQVKYYIYNPFGGAKDANEALLTDREALTKEVTQTADQLAQIAEAEEAKKLEAEREEYSKTSVNNYLQDFIDGISESANTPATPTGFNNLDNLLDGGLYEGLYILGAITSLGKTTFLLQITDQIAQAGQDVIIFSLEMSRSELVSKSISRLTLLETLSRGEDTSNAKTNRGITTGSRWKNYSEKERDIISTAVNIYENYSKHIRIEESIGNFGVEDVRRAIAKHKRLTGKAPIVIIDYLQILAPYDERLSDKQNTDKSVLELKRISREYKATIIGISSFNRDNYTAPVNLASFKESGAIEYSSDVLIGLQFEGMDYQPCEKQDAHNARVRQLRETMEAKGREGLPQRIEVKILKSRNGYKGKVLMDFFPRFNYFKAVES